MNKEKKYRVTNAIGDVWDVLATGEVAAKRKAFASYRKLNSLASYNDFFKNTKVKLQR